jgi:GT2 family glycosyltransferase
MKILAEISQGLGNCIQGTPMLQALKLLGHDVDLLINADRAGDFRALWDGWDVVNRIFTSSREVRPRDYDFGVSAHGRREAVRLMPPGLCLKVEKHHMEGLSETDANLRLARWLGYSGPAPRAYVNRAARDFGLPRDSVAVHAGCDTINQPKRWPHWPEVCARLKAEGRHVVVVGTDMDRSADSWEDAFDARFNLPLPELAALLEQVGHYLGNDSGVGHLAAAVGTPGLVLFGPSCPVKNRPNSCVLKQLVVPAENDEQRDVRGRNPVPMDRLSMEQAWPEILAVLERTSREPARALPKAATDSVEERWQRYIRNTIEQPEPELIERANLPPGHTPRVSVVIPTFNRAGVVMRAVNSALAQAGPEVEVLVVDDGSTDETSELFQHPPPRVRYLRKAGGGASSARNAGLRRAQGEWVALLDSDDEWLPGKLAKQLTAMGSAYVASATRHLHVDPDGSRHSRPQVLPGASRHLFSDLYDRQSIKTSSLVLKRHLLERIGLFHEDFAVSNDWDFFLRMARLVNNSGFVVLPEPLVIVHRSHDSISRTARVRALQEAYTRICMINGLLHVPSPDLVRRHIARAGRKHVELARALRKQGDKAAARHHARQALRARISAEGLWHLVQAL